MPVIDPTIHYPEFGQDSYEVSALLIATNEEDFIRRLDGISGLEEGWMENKNVQKG